jgi:isochorismate hydrolase
MKEEYFTDNNIEQKSFELINRLPEKSLRGIGTFRPDNSALLVLDMQQYFLNPNSHAYIPSGNVIVTAINRLIAYYTQHQQPIIFTRHTNTPQDAGQMQSWWQDMVTPDHPLIEITDDLDVSAGIVISKHQYDAFYQTNLEAYLKRRNISQVVITGVMTHLCCETTARAAFMRGFNVFFPVDGTATYNQDFHLATLLNLSHGFAAIILMDDIIKSSLR